MSSSNFNLKNTSNGKQELPISLPSVERSHLNRIKHEPNYGYGTGTGQLYPFGPPYRRSSSGNETMYTPKSQHHCSLNQYNNEDKLVEWHVASGRVCIPSYNHNFR
ncbi:hypothetical protein GYMLUDRAFT_60695 [Collybiopsis luxurians FD-317 M1]|uniref:Uncharacterized protein n=1 Tax=Collybiopsis luxurians FD-317 M1 TaxID=944289 RepID=A0A0D0CRT9_9AGAR|nr:hypothetical protein GYMLUDRAFT_60695 [Collybiopsis luxurians FD-317 M1]